MGHSNTTSIELIAIDQPFTPWRLHSFLKNNPKDLDDAALVDGCTRFEPFRHIPHPCHLARGNHNRSIMHFLSETPTIIAEVRNCIMQSRSHCMSDHKWKNRLKGYGQHIRRKDHRQMLKTLPDGVEICALDA